MLLTDSVLTASVCLHFNVYIFHMSLCISVTGGHEGRKYGRQTLFPNPHVCPASPNLSLLSTLVGSLHHTADISAVLLLHCQGANKP